MNKISRNAISIALLLNIALLGLTQSVWAVPMIDSVTASPSVPASARYSYKSENLIDGNSATAWCTRAQRAGKAWIRLLVVKPAYWNGFGIFNGYGRNDRSFLRNSRIKAIKVYLDGKSAGDFTVRDTSTPQWFALKRTKARELKIEVLSEYKGNRDDDLCATELVADSSVIRIYGLLDKVIKAVGARALSAGDIKRIYHPLLKFMTDNKPSENAALEDAVALSVDGRGEAQLRMAMNLFYLADSQSSVNVDLEEALSARMIYFFSSNPEAVLRVWNDKAQIEREQLAGAYSTFTAQFDDEGMRKYKQAHPVFRKISSLIESETGMQ